MNSHAAPSNSSRQSAAADTPPTHDAANGQNGNGHSGTPDRIRLTPDEVRAALSHYNLGKILSAKTYPRGSRHSPKLLLRTDRGRFLLKRRADGKDDRARVEFAHALMHHLRGSKFPLPGLMRSREGHPAIEIHGHVYEVFEYVDAQRYKGSLEETMHAGYVLGRLHARTKGFRRENPPAALNYHDRQDVIDGLGAIPSITSSLDSVVGHETELLMTTIELADRYRESADAIRAAGYDSLEHVVLHGDWHPGNMLFTNNHVAVVLDFDAARPGPPIVEVANGMLQFSMLRSEHDPVNWPAFFDETRMRRFLIGYSLRLRLPQEQRQLIPDFMIESLIAETSVPIAVTGSFGHMPGFGVLQMAKRKVRWLLENKSRMQRWLAE
ncbi:MAG: phosphotransferase enzyme family protein [Phycisphaerae bacterium]